MISERILIMIIMLGRGVEPLRCKGLSFTQLPGSATLTSPVLGLDDVVRLAKLRLYHL